MEYRPRVVVALQDRTECAAVADWLTAKGYDPLPRSSLRAAADEMHAQAFDLLITDAGFALQDGLRRAERTRNTRIPVILIGNATEEPKGHAVNGQAMFLARPLDQATLMCFVLMAILDHRPERRSIRKPVTHIDAYVNGLPVRIVDVSNEGLCLVTPPDRSSLLPPSFNVRIPLVGVSLVVQRVWGRRAKPGASTTWYGGALTQNLPAAEQGWRSFVDTIPLVHGIHRTMPATDRH
jgi:CheY-like chemotaxis protein